jgi:hypothetical protein
MGRVNEIWRVAPNPRVVVSQRQATVEFVLRPNQTFSSYAMDVLEGKLTPVTIDNTIVQIPAEDLQAPSPLPADEEKTSGEAAGNEGLGGLINSYKRLGDTPTPTQPAPANQPQ